MSGSGSASDVRVVTNVEEALRLSSADEPQQPRSLLSGRLRGAKKSFRLPPHVTKKVFTGELVITRNNKVRRTAVEHIRMMVVHRDRRSGSESGSATLELQFDYNGSDSAAARSVKVFDFENAHSRENFQRLVSALLYCREALMPVFDVRNKTDSCASGVGRDNESVATVGDILETVFHKKKIGLSSSTASAELSYEDALLFCHQEIENQALSLKIPFHMLPNELMEHPPQTCDVMLSCMLDGKVSKVPVYGRLYMTDFRLVFMPHFSTYEGRNLKAYPFQIPLHSLVAVKWVDAGTVIAAQTKTLRSLKFTFTDASTVKTLFSKIVARAYKNPAHSDCSSFTFSRRHITDNRSVQMTRHGPLPLPPPVGWQTYSELAEFLRLGALGPDSSWCLYDNSSFKTLPTYPPFVLLPKPQLFSPKDFMGTISFRSKRRIPAIVWVHPRHGAVIARCSMPLVGVSKKFSMEDEKLAEIYRQRPAPQSTLAPRKGASTEDDTQDLYIFDARPSLNSTATRLKGGGQEDGSRYNRGHVVNLGIGNIHVMRNSLTALARACEHLIDSDAAAGAARSDWLHHLHLILSGAAQIARVVDVEKCSAIVHCSDGWDRTPQLTATAQLLLDPYYRTFRGFGVLVEKEFCSFGHKFGERLAHGEPPHSSREDDVDTRGSQRYFSNTKECSPVFVQFLDVCHQLLSQFPFSFEFTESYLLFLAEHIHSCRFGNFLCDNAAERAAASVFAQCENIWEYMESKEARSVFTNTAYAPYPDTLWPLTNDIQMRLWHSYFSRLETRQIPAPIPEVHERIEVVGEGEEWLAGHRYERFSEEYLQKFARGPCCKVRVQKLISGQAAWNECWGLTIRKSELHLYRRSDFVNMALEEIVKFKPHVSINLQSVSGFEVFDSSHAMSADERMTQHLSRIAETVDLFSHSMSPSRRGTMGQSLKSIAVDEQAFMQSIVVQLKGPQAGPDWCIQFPGVTSYKFWKTYLDHALKGVDFMRMVADGSLREEEYMVVMRKNAEHIDLDDPLAGLAPVDESTKVKEVSGHSAFCFGGAVAYAAARDADAALYPLPTM